MNKEPRLRTKLDISFSAQSLSHVHSLFATLWTVTCHAPYSWDFSGKNASGLPFPLPDDLPDPGIEPASPALAGGFFTTVPRGKSG